MSDRINDELLSAYLDNEVTAEERAEVQQALADSPATRRSLESLKQVQARLQAVPRLALSADFTDRVVQEAERRAAARQVALGTATTRKWMRRGAVVATLAAVLVVAVMFAVSRNGSEVVEMPTPDQMAPDQRTVVQQDQPLPEDNVFVATTPRPQPKFILVLDLAITRAGQREDVFGQGLRQAGIPFDANNEGVVLDHKLRDELLETRFVADTGNPAQMNDRFDVIDMVYVHGTGAQIDDIYQRMTNHDQVRVVLDVAFQPETTQVLNSIGQRSWSLAMSEASATPKSYAYRLDVGFTLHSSRSGFFAKFPTPGVDVRVLDGDAKRDSMTGFSLPIPLDFGGGPRQEPANDKADGNAPQGVEDPVYEILVIRRNLKAGFPAQKP